MALHDVSLSDRYDLDKREVLLSGTQALIRAMLMQRARDQAEGHSTAGYATGYRGSPLGGLDMQMQRAASELAAADVKFEPGLNEDLAATALWGSQQVALRGEGRVAGVFGLWYGKGPGVDRSGDVFRHANMAGTAPLGGVIACMGDDHTGESSTTLHHSEFAFVDALMPILSPAGVQEVLDHAILGWALSRFSGCWVGLKCVKDTIEVSEVVNGDPVRLRIAEPEGFEMPPGGLGIRLGDTPAAQEARLHDHKRYAAEAFARANGLDRAVWPRDGARIGIVSSGKAWRDTVHALALLGLDGAAARQIGITTYKIGMVWPLETRGFLDWARGLDLIAVVEEKRKLLEPQIKDALFHEVPRSRVVGWKTEDGQVAFPVTGALDPVGVAVTLGRLIAAEGLGGPALAERVAGLEADLAPLPGEVAPPRQPWFCSGCPHNSSTRLPEGARAYAGIGCHYMVQWMDRETEGFTHMGGEGANWIGEAPFSTRDHVFQNIGDGTYNHSGVQAIRAALAAGVNITYKILFNDAVAMTGGQANDGGLSPHQIAHELVAMGVERVAVVHDPKETPDRALYPQGVPLRPRDDLDAVQRELQTVPGVTAIIYVQTCAAEKRRRRKRGAFPDPDMRVFINPEVCEGCGDCGLQSNCVSILPLETPFGRKRMIDQSACNKDYSCLKGFCPSFVTLSGAELRRPETAETRIPDLPEPPVPAISETYNIVATGIGGTGVVTVGALLAMAARLEGKGAAVIEMAGLAQKGGAVQVHIRIAERPEDISTVRVAAGEAHALIAGDLVVSASERMRRLVRSETGGAVLNTHATATGRFALERDLDLPWARMRAALIERVGPDRLNAFDATALAARLVGDAVYANVLLLGAAWQAGLVPLSRAALHRAIELNGAAPGRNRQAFEVGRWAVAEPGAAPLQSPSAPAPEAASLEEVTDRRAQHLAAYQGRRLAVRYRARVEKMRAVDRDLARAVAVGYHKLLSYKDEYEVARLHGKILDDALAGQFGSPGRLTFHLAPPFLAGADGNGRRRKRAFGPWIRPVLRMLSGLRWLRGTVFDPFGYSRERRHERQLIREYEADIDALPGAMGPPVLDAARELAALPLEIRGFGPVKAAAAERAAARRAELRAIISAGGAAPQADAEAA